MEIYLKETRRKKQRRTYFLEQVRRLKGGVRPSWFRVDFLFVFSIFQKGFFIFWNSLDFLQKNIFLIFSFFGILHTYTVAFSPTVLTICSQSFTDAHAAQRLKKTIHGILSHTVINCARGVQSDRRSIRRLCGGQPAGELRAVQTLGGP